MSYDAKAKMSFGEARRAVIDKMQACRVGMDALELAMDGDLDALKTAEYALLVPIVTKGLEELLAESKPEGHDTFLNPSALSTHISHDLGRKVVKHYEQNPHREVIDHFARQRANQNPRNARLIYPVESTLGAAASFSASQLYGVAVSNALAIYLGGGMSGRSRGDFISSVKRSHQLALSAPIVHLEWNGLASDELVNHGLGIIKNAPSLNGDALVYDAAADKAVLNRPLEDWLVKPGLAIMEVEPQKISSYEPADARIGCPVSFNPYLVKGYYEYVVDEIESHQAWPDQIADPEKLKARQIDVIAQDLGLYPGMRI